MDEADYDKIVDLDKTTILSNIAKLKKYTHYIQPSKRLNYRFVKITNETDIIKLNDPSTNYLMISSHPYKFVFKNYKTYKKDLNNIIDCYARIGIQ